MAEPAQVKRARDAGMELRCITCAGNSSDPHFNCSDCRNFDYWMPRTPEHDALYEPFGEPMTYEQYAEDRKRRGF